MYTFSLYMNACMFIKCTVYNLHIKLSFPTWNYSFRGGKMNLTHQLYQQLCSNQVACCKLCKWHVMVRNDFTHIYTYVQYCIQRIFIGIFFLILFWNKEWDNNKNYSKSLHHLRENKDKQYITQVLQEDAFLLSTFLLIPFYFVY